MRNTLIAVLLALILGAGVASYVITRQPGRGPQVSIDASRTAVIKEMRQLGRLETASFTIEKIIEAKKEDAATWRNVLFGDKLLLIAHGEVVAGIDLSGLGEDAVRVMDGTLRIDLPAPIVFSTRLDNAQTRVYDRSQGLLSRGDKDLESEARKAAETSIHAAACDANILDTAALNAQKQLKTMLSSFGFKDVVVEVGKGEC